jgi:hypothetical protein
MKKKIKSFLFLLLVSSILYGCQSVTDGLTLKKKGNSQQFLIEKKQPLVMPPEFDKLPEPGSINLKNEEQNNSNQNLDLNKLIKSSSKDIKNSSDKKSISSELEKKISEELNKQ